MTDRWAHPSTGPEARHGTRLPRKYSELLASIAQEFPSFRILPKSHSRLNRAIDVVLRAITLGAQGRYLTHYHTVLGTTLYVPTSWSDASEIDRMIILCHERVHLRQRQRWGPWLMAFLYLVPLFPLGLAYGRARLEWEAYTETLRATAAYRGLAALESVPLRALILQRFTGADYGWMWPFARAVSRWYDTAVREIRASARELIAPGSLEGSRQDATGAPASRR